MWKGTQQGANLLKQDGVRWRQGDRAGCGTDKKANGKALTPFTCLDSRAGKPGSSGPFGGTIGSPVRDGWGAPAKRFALHTAQGDVNGNSDASPAQGTDYPERGVVQHPLGGPTESPRQPNLHHRIRE